MKRHYRFASVLLTAMLALSVPALAHDGDGQGGPNGAPGYHNQDGQDHHWMLSKEKRELLHKTMKSVFQKDKPLFEQLHKLHRQQHDLLAAQNFDSQAFLSVNEQAAKLHEQIHADKIEAFASIAGKFTPQERMMIALHFAHHPMHGGHHGHHMWHHGADRDDAGQPRDHMGHAQTQDGNTWRERPAQDVAPAQIPSDDRAYPPYPPRY